MVKQRFSTADLAAEVGALRNQLHGMRVTNVFDISSRVCVALVALVALLSSALYTPGAVGLTRVTPAARSL